MKQMKCEAARGGRTLSMRETRMPTSRFYGEREKVESVTVGQLPLSDY